MNEHHAYSIRGSSVAIAFAAAALAAAVPLAALAAASASPYGVCAHVSRVGFAYRDKEFRLAATLGAPALRTDFDWARCQPAPDAPFDFSRFDAVVSSAEAAGVQVLPILAFPPQWARPLSEHLPEWGRFVGALASHFGERLPVLEIWNEENGGTFWSKAWGGEPDGAAYTLVLRTAAEAARRAFPGVRIVFGGTAGVPLDFIGRCYESGAAPFFDAMAVHPYCHPGPPEGALDARLEALRALMEAHGDGGKPVLVTELGWPTHDASIPDLALLKAGLAAARPNAPILRIAYASAGGNGEATAAALRDALPPGTTCEALHGDALRRRLAGGGVDAVVYPFDETFPADTHDDVVAFVMRGGVLVDLGGMPMWRPVTEPEPGRFVRLDDDEAGEARRKLRISAEAWWTAPALPREDRAFPTAAARAAGFRGDPAGELANRFQTPRFLRDGDKFTPLLTTPGGAVAASLTHLAEGGCVVVGGARRKGAAETITEETQARYLVRSLAICFAEGVGQYFWYELRANENDPFYSENHFGLMHHNLTPKPAWGAYLNFTLARPSGSEQKPGPWRDGACGLYFPQWTRPDGTPAGVIWKTGASEKMALRFAAADGTTAADVRFRTCTGRLLKPARGADGAWIVAVGEEPVFFEGALLDAGALLRQRQNQGLEP